ncbi:MAG: hypothetical protein WCO56_14720 [Verrucomicrobiota bacterium]
MMRLMLSVLAAASLVCGCATQTGRQAKLPETAPGSGEAGSFILEQALTFAARPVKTNDLPEITGQWRYSKDEYGATVLMTREQFFEAEAFLHQLFGKPEREQCESVYGGILATYDAASIGAEVLYGYDNEGTHISVLKAMTNEELATALKAHPQDKRFLRSLEYHR